MKREHAMPALPDTAPVTRLQFQNEKDAYAAERLLAASHYTDLQRNVSLLRFAPAPKAETFALLMHFGIKIIESDHWGISPLTPDEERLLDWWSFHFDNPEQAHAFTLQTRADFRIPCFCFGVWAHFPKSENDFALRALAEDIGNLRETVIVEPESAWMD